MIETLIAVLILLWIFGFFVVHIGSVIHILLVLVLVGIVVRLIRGDRVL